MASFDGHSKCAHCRDKGVGEDDCVLKKDCAVCKGFTPEQVLQLATPTYRERKSREKKVVAFSPAPTLVDPSHVRVLGKVEGGKAVKPETTPAVKKSKHSESPKTASKKNSSSSSKPSAEDLQKLDDKWAERFSRLEAMLLAKSFTVPVEPVVKPAEVTSSQTPFFDPGASTSSLANETSRPSLLRLPVPGQQPSLSKPPVQSLMCSHPVRESVQHLAVRVTSKVLPVPCLTSTTGTSPQTETSPGKRLQIGNFQRRPGTERQCEVSEALWVGTRFQSLKLCSFLMTTLLPVHVSNPPVKCL